MAPADHRPRPTPPHRPRTFDPSLSDRELAAPVGASGPDPLLSLPRRCCRRGGRGEAPWSLAPWRGPSRPASVGGARGGPGAGAAKPLAVAAPLADAPLAEVAPPRRASPLAAAGTGDVLPPMRPAARLVLWGAGGTGARRTCCRVGAGAEASVGPGAAGEGAAGEARATCWRLGAVDEFSAFSASAFACRESRGGNYGTDWGGLPPRVSLKNERRGRRGTWVPSQQNAWWCKTLPTHHHRHLGMPGHGERGTGTPCCTSPARRRCSPAVPAAPCAAGPCSAQGIG